MTGYSVFVQSDGKIVTAGYAYTDKRYDFALIRYNTDGTLDTTFGSGGKVSTDIGTLNDFGQSVFVQSDGKIVVAGKANNGSTTDFAVVRYRTDGTLDDGNLYFLDPLPNPIGYTEDEAAAVLASHLGISDNELNSLDNYAGSYLSLSRQGGANSEDEFSALGELGEVTEGGALIVSGTIIGTVTTNSGGTLTLSFDENATQVLVDRVIQGIAYANSSDATPHEVVIGWTFNDGNAGDQGAGGALTVTGSTAVHITSTNDAPLLIGSAPTLTNVSVRQTNPTGQSVASFLGNSLSDPDGISPQGIAMHVLSGSAGRWQFRLEGQGTWTDAGSVSTADALLLKSTDFVRFMPDGTVTTQASISYYGWDQSSGAAGSRIDASVRGGITAFSTLSNTATLKLFDTVISSTSYTL